MSKSKTDLSVQSTIGTNTEDTQKPNPNFQEWQFKISGSGNSGWMSYASVDGGKNWYALRQSNTSFLSASTAIEPELIRLAYPHKSPNGAK